MIEIEHDVQLNDLVTIRGRMDAISFQLAQLVAERQELALLAAELKRADKKPLRDLGREAIVMRDMQGHFDGLGIYGSRTGIAIASTLIGSSIGAQQQHLANLAQ